MREPVGRIAGGVTGLVVVLVLLSGCGGDSEAPKAPASPPPAQESSPSEVFNPCDGLDPARVESLLGTSLIMDDGAAGSPRCAFAPGEEGGPVLDANYSIYPDGLDAAFASMSGLDPDDVREVEVRGADAARIVTDFDDRQLFVSGFVQTGEVITTLDVVDPAPYDEPQTVRAVRGLLADLAAHAAASGEGS